MKERAEKAQAALAAMTKQRDDYREGARIEAAEGDLARKENDELRAALAEAVSIFSEFRRCTEAKKLPDDHHDDDEYCEEGTCMWIGEQATDFIARLKQAQEGPKP